SLSAQRLGADALAPHAPGGASGALHGGRAPARLPEGRHRRRCRSWRRRGLSLSARVRALDGARRLRHARARPLERGPRRALRRALRGRQDRPARVPEAHMTTPQSPAAPPRRPDGPSGLRGQLVFAGFGKDPLGFVERLARDYPGAARLPMPGTALVYLTEPDAIGAVLLDRERVFIKDWTTRSLGPVIGNGLFTSEGDFWRRQRNLVVPPLHRKQLGAYVEIAARRAAAWGATRPCASRAPSRKRSPRSRRSSTRGGASCRPRGRSPCARASPTRAQRST